MLCGGPGEQKEPSDDVHAVVATVKEHVETKLGSKFPVFEAKAYKSQVVAGQNFFVKVHVGDGKYLHLRIFRSLQKEVQLHGVQEGKKEEDAVEYFQS